MIFNHFKSIIFGIIMLCHLSPSLAQEQLDKDFGKGGKLNINLTDSWCAGEAACLQPDGKLIVGGWIGNENHVGLVRLLPNGTFDNSFGKNGKLIIPLRLRSYYLSRVAIALQKDGGIIIAGNGILKNTNNFDVLTEKKKDESALISIDQSGMLMDKPEGESIDILLIKIKKNGQLDKTFGNKGIARINADADDSVQSLIIDDKDNIFVSGISEKITVGRSMYVIKANKIGKIDATFGTKGKCIFKDVPYTFGGFLAMNKTNIVIAGLAHSSSESETQYLHIYALSQNGKPNTAFGENGKFIFNQTKLVAADCQLHFVSNELVVTANKDSDEGGRDVVFFKLTSKGTLSLLNNAPYRLIRHQYNGVIMASYPCDDYMLLGGSCSINEQNKFLILKINYNGEIINDFGEKGGFIGGFENEMNLGMHVFQDKKNNIYLSGTTGWIDMKYAVIKVITNLEADFEELSPTTASATAVEIGTPNIILAYPNPVIQSELAIKVTLSYDSKMTGIIYDFEGKQLGYYDLGALNTGTHQVQIPIDGLASGYYFIRVFTSKESKTLRVLVQH